MAFSLRDLVITFAKTGDLVIPGLSSSLPKVCQDMKIKLKVKAKVKVCAKIKAIVEAKAKVKAQVKLKDQARVQS